MDNSATKFYLLTGGLMDPEPKPGELERYFDAIFTKPPNWDAMSAVLGKHRGKKILIVDDDPMVANLMEARTRTIELVPYVFYDPQKALAAYSDLKPDVVLTDYSMPGMTGFDMVKLMKENGVSK